MENANDMTPKKETPWWLLFAAAKYGKSDVIKQFTTTDFDINYIDNELNLAVDYAWENEFYDVVLLLLQMDSCFPKKFDMSKLSESNECSKNLIEFVEERKLLHRYIKANDLGNVQNYIENKSESKFYLNQNNISAVCTALKFKNADIQAYLTSIGAEFLNDDEKEKYENLEFKDQLALRNANLIYFPSVSKPHIDYLISKSRTQAPVKGSRNRLKKLYSKLDEIPEVSCILKVIQYSDYSDIIYDFGEENVRRLNPLCSKNTTGEALYKEGRVYIAAGPEREEKKIMGTTAHELTHMAMQILYENECNPYMATEDNKERENFEKIKKRFFLFLFNASQVPNDDPYNIVLNVKKAYSEDDHHSELIVTVPQILAECEFGRKWLHKNASELMNFYSGTIIPKCNEFIKQSPMLKVKNKIRKFNESLGNLIKLRKFNLFFRRSFENVDWVKNFLSIKDKNIFLLKTEHTYLGLVKVLQALFGRNYMTEFDKYLALNFEDLVTELQVMQVFLNGCDKLILQFNKDVHQEQLIEFFNLVSNLLDISPNKCIIFILHPRVEDKLKQALQTLINLPIESKIIHSNSLWNSALSLSCFDENSTISSKEITFQGMKIKLSDLIATDEHIVNFITGNMIEGLIEGKDICIGNKTAEYYGTEKLFGNVDEQINMETFIYELKNSEDIFVIHGFENQLDLEEKFVAHFDEYINRNLIDRDTIVGHIQIINADWIGVTNKRIILTDQFSDDDVKQFCLINCDKNIYFIQFENRSFILKQFYSSAFYVKRQFKIFVTDRKTLTDLVSLKSTILPWSVDQFRELFIISRTDNDVNFNDFNIYPNVRVLRAQDAETSFNHFYENEAEAKDRWFRLRYDDKEIRVHWFQAKNPNEIHWINSYGSIESLQYKFRRLDINNKSLITEKDLVPFLAYKKVVLFAGTPGLGKSTSLTKLYESPLIAKTHWTIRINLEEHVTKIRDINTANFSIEDFFQLLKNIKPCLNNELTTHTLTSILTRESGFKKCLFVFDGFDKILEEELNSLELRKKTTFLLKFIQKNTKSKIWIATRLHHKKELEDILSTFALEFDSLNNGDKEHLVDNFFRYHLKLALKPKPDLQPFDWRIRIYRKTFLEYIEKLFHRRRLAFIETPWQLTLIMMNTTNHFVNWANNPYASPSDVAYLGRNRSEFSERFVRIPADVYTGYFPTVSVLDRIPMPDMNRVINFFNVRYFPPALIVQSVVLLFALSHIAQSWKLFFLLSLYMTCLILDRILAIQRAYIQVMWYTCALLLIALTMMNYLISLSKPPPQREIPFLDEIHRIYTSSYRYLSDVLTRITG